MKDLASPCSPGSPADQRLHHGTPRAARDFLQATSTQMRSYQTAGVRDVCFTRVIAGVNFRRLAQALTPPYRRAPVREPPTPTDAFRGVLNAPYPTPGGRR